jgi:hypothetical protein
MVLSTIVATLPRLRGIILAPGNLRVVVAMIVAIVVAGIAVIV